MVKEFIVHLYEFEIPKSDIERMSENELAFLSTLAFCVDEIAVFTKLLVQTFHVRPRYDELLSHYQIQQNVLMRSLNAKSFEGFKILRGYKKLLEREGGQQDRLAKIDGYLVELQDLEADPAFELAQSIRDHATNHYIPSETNKNLKNISKRSRFLAYIHETSGNSRYPFGEECVFLARIGRYYSDAGKDSYTMDDVGAWIDWGIKSSRFLSKTLQDYLKWLQDEHFPNWYVTVKKPWLEACLYSEIDEAHLPIILGTEDYIRRRNMAED